MKIAKDKVASFHYILRDEQGEVIENSHDASPVLYLHGARNIVAGLEAELEGREPEDEVRVTVEPAQGYGEYDETLRQRVPLKRLQGVKKLKPGMRLQVNTSRGTRAATVMKVGRFHADLDGNHPFAGKRLDFEVKVLDVRDATQEELRHGHAHGEGGHEHG